MKLGGKEEIQEGRKERGEGKKKVKRKKGRKNGRKE